MNYISLIDLITQSTTSKLWFDYIMKSNSSTTSSCPRCERISNIRSHNNELSKFVFIEFSAGLLSLCRFQNEIKLFKAKYKLTALAKPMFAHFSAAVCNN